MFQERKVYRNKTCPNAELDIFILRSSVLTNTNDYVLKVWYVKRKDNTILFVPSDHSSGADTIVITRMNEPLWTPLSIN